MECGPSVGTSIFGQDRRFEAFREGEDERPVGYSGCGVEFFSGWCWVGGWIIVSRDGGDGGESEETISSRGGYTTMQCVGCLLVMVIFIGCGAVTPTQKGRGQSLSFNVVVFGERSSGNRGEDSHGIIKWRYRFVNDLVGFDGGTSPLAEEGFHVERWLAGVR